jgi:hypothetical protein
MIEELDLVVLVRNIPEHGLASGDVGTVVHRYPAGAAYEVEFAAAAGVRTVAVLTLEPQDVRLLRENEILAVRQLTPAP